MTASAAVAWCPAGAESGWAQGPAQARELAPGQGQAPGLAREPGLAPERVPVPVTGRALSPPGVVRSHLLLRRSP
jgi:hypothetical protein